MVLNDQQRALITAILAALATLISWHELCLRVAMLGGRGRGRGNEILRNPRSNWDGARDVALRRLYEDSEAICHSETPTGVIDGDPMDTMGSQAEKEAPRTRKRKRKDPLATIMESSVSSLVLVSESINALRVDIARANTEVDLAGNLWTALNNTDGLTKSQKLAANGILGENPNSAKSFLATPDEYKNEAVTILLSRHRKR